MRECLWDCLAREENETEEQQDNILGVLWSNNARIKKFETKQKAVCKYKQGHFLIVAQY